MRAIPGLLFVSACLTSTMACGAPPSENVGSQVEAEISSLVDSASSHGLDSFCEYGITALKSFYGEDSSSVWVRNSIPSDRAHAVIGAMKSASSKGLQAADYDASLWDQRIAAARNGTPAAEARFDVTLSACFLEYATDLRFGRVRQPSTAAEISLAGSLRTQIAGSASPLSVLANLEPPYPGYRRLMIALDSYRTLVTRGNPSLLAPRSVQPGDPWSEAAELARVLRLTGDLPANSVIYDPSIYEEPLVNALRHFQSRHGLNPDGIIGRATIASLNIPFAKRVRQIELTLERWREAPRSFGRPPIIVNIPEFGLHALGPNYETELSMKVIIGGAFGHQTPVFQSDMTYIIFRPYWDVPYNITRRELMPHLRKNPEYFPKNHYEAIDDKGNRVEWNAPGLDHRLLSGTVRIRQVPGDDNALGAVKFMFPNTHNVYLHGTPAVQLFSQSRRDFSHGCIRVEKPQDLAEWVLRGLPEWTPERIRGAMGGDTPLRVNLRQPIPVLIVYGTALVTEAGEVRFFEDIYGLDQTLEKALAKRRHS